jgi:uncharacterized surface protein with fasciclin (FAS1) repeats
MKTLVETAAADRRFATFVAALKASNLIETLSSDGPYTVFAPTDDAFKKLLPGSMDTLLKGPSGRSAADAALPDRSWKIECRRSQETLLC